MKLDCRCVALGVPLVLMLFSCSGESDRAISTVIPLPSNGTPGSQDPTGVDVDPVADGDPLFGFPEGEAQLDALCARGNRDAVALAFCTNPRPTIRSLAELQALLGLAFQPGNLSNGRGNPQFALTGHSSSLVARSVNALNPRAILFTPRLPQGRSNPQYVAMGFARGEQIVELAAKDPSAGRFRFYLVTFKQACNASPSGCSLADLLTPDVERNWTEVTVYEDADLRNTILDCLHCHQPQGPASTPILRLQEFPDPWTHWFRADRPSRVLISDFQSAHPSNETYAGIPGGAIIRSDALQLELSLTEEGQNLQPNAFNSAAIEDEVQETGRSETWQVTYDAAAQGRFIPVPFFGIRVTDNAKLQAAARSYRNVVTGNAPRESLLDLRELFDERILPDLSFRPRVNASGEQILLQMCARCHNPKLDQSISRARFDATAPATMSAEQKAKAIERLQLPASSRRKMPPPRFGELSQDELNRVIELLRN